MERRVLLITMTKDECSHVRTMDNSELMALWVMILMVKFLPHEHKATYNDRGYLDKKYYREIDKNGKAVGPWIPEK